MRSWFSHCSIIKRTPLRVRWEGGEGGMITANRCVVNYDLRSPHAMRCIQKTVTKTVCTVLYY
jgi:hypothetical protein